MTDMRYLYDNQRLRRPTEDVKEHLNLMMLSHCSMSTVAPLFLATRDSTNMPRILSTCSTCHM